MPKKLRKSLKTYFSKLKKIPSLKYPSSSSHGQSLLSACKYPRTPSFSGPHRRDHPVDTAATLSDVDRFLHENFHSLYLNDDHECHADAATNDNHVKASERFFVSPRRTSSSLMTSSSSSVPGDGVAVTTFSKDPYSDFRDSMKEMVEARHKGEQQETSSLDWDFMEEMLFCYLELNDRGVHKHILRAFTDLAVGFQRRTTTTTTTTKGRRRRKVVVEHDVGEGLTEMAPQEKVKECYYNSRCD